MPDRAKADIAINYVCERNSSRRTRLSIFPDGLRGNELTKRKSRGTLKPAKNLRQC